MQLADIDIIDNPYTLYILTGASLHLAPALIGLSAEASGHLARLGDGVIESVLNFPQDIEGRRDIARARFRETLTFERDYASWRLGRSPAMIVAASLDGAAIDPAELIVQGATGVIRLAAGCWPAGAALSVDYDGGWLTPRRRSPRVPRPISDRSCPSRSSPPASGPPSSSIRALRAIRAPERCGKLTATLGKSRRPTPRRQSRPARTPIFSGSSRPGGGWCWFEGGNLGQH